MSVRTVALLAGLLLALPSCSGINTSPVPATPTNISGDYAGTVVDSAAGSLPATALLAQHGSSAGGTITSAPGGVTLVSSLSLGIDSSNAVSGTMVQDLPGDITCSFAVTGTYGTSNGVLSGSYHAITGCSGQTGTYTMTQSCTDTVTTGDKKPAPSFGIPGC
jgi:hypothetical protein